MPFVFIVVGIVMIISGVRGKSQDLTTLVKGDLTGKNNFIYWIISIMVIGGLGYIKDLQTFSRALLALVIVVLILAEEKNGNGGFFTQFQNAVNTITKGS